MTLLYAGGCLAYNRWLGSFAHADRQAAQAQITYDDVEAAVADIRRASQAGMRGVLVDGHMRNLPPLYDDYYEPDLVGLGGTAADGNLPWWCWL
jgi:hypothetical protein